MKIKFPNKDHEYGKFSNIRIPMRDGTLLRAYLYLPTKNGKPDLSKKYPVILDRSPYAYCIELGDSLYPTFIDYYATAHDYAVVLCSVRGTNGSEGEFEPMMNEGWGEKQDGVDTVKWIQSQSWCNGKVASVGCSYCGATQALIHLTEDIPGFETSCISIPALNAGSCNWPFENGFFTYQLCLLWVFILMKDQLDYHKYSPEVEVAILKDNELLNDPLGHPERMDFGGWIKKYGLRDIPIARHVPFWQKWVDNYDNVNFYDYNNTAVRTHDVSKPLMVYGGWYDLFINNSLQLYEKLVADAPNEEVAKGHRLVIGPSAHNRTPGAREFPNGDTDQDSMCLEWIEQQLRGEQSEFLNKAPVFMFVMGENRWSAEPEWPFPDVEPTRYYLHSSGHANSLGGDGVLNTEIPGNEMPDQYFADPAKPVPTMMEHFFFGGAIDQRLNEERKDVLVYTSPVLTEDVEIGGYIRASLYAATNATDTDFVMKLIDVEPNGTAINVVTGGVRGRYRKNRKMPEALVPGRVEQFEIAMRAACMVFKKGHRIRVEVMSSDAYMWDPNPNRFIDLRTCTEKDYFVAEQTVYHDASRASYVELPIVPASHKREWIDNWPYSPEVTGGYDTFYEQTLPEAPFSRHELGENLIHLE